MTHVVTQNCCNDASCVAVCPVNCIHPTPGTPEFASAEMLFIDPDVCIDCGACVAPCPVSAIYPDYELPDHLNEYEHLNAAFFAERDAEPAPAPPGAEKLAWSGEERLRVAVVGSGPAAFYAAEELLAQRGLVVEVDMFERLPVVGGLVRYGVAPDHQSTKQMLDQFGDTMRRPGYRLFANVEIGRDVSHGDLLSRYHAVLYAVGAMGDRTLGIPGEDLPGSHSATNFVAWYNGHPEFSSEVFDLSCERVVIVGNGNVALDVARVLSSDPDSLRRTDISVAALEALEESKVREVVIVGRRGAEDAAFSSPELRGLIATPGIDVVVPEGELGPPRPPDAHAGFSVRSLKRELLAQQQRQRGPSGARRIAFRFLRTPVAVLGTDSVEGVRLAVNDLVDEGGVQVARATGEVEDLECGMILRAVGYRARALPDLPFDEQHSTLPQIRGRVLDGSGEPLRGVYASGWVKRGPSGVIGTNRSCAAETVQSLLNDYRDGKLARDLHPDDLAAVLPQAVDAHGARAIDAHERESGRCESRSRIKLLSVDEMLRVAGGVW